MAKTETLVDTFASADSGKWNYGGTSGDASVSGGQVSIANGNILNSVSTYDLTSSYIFTEMVSGGASGALIYYDIATFEGITFAFDGTDLIANDILGGQLHSGTYSPTNHRWLRMRESSGTVMWDTSPDGVTWSTWYSSSYAVGTAWSIALNGAGTIFDNVNNAPSPANTSAFFVMF